MFYLRILCISNKTMFKKIQGGVLKRSKKLSILTSLLIAASLNASFIAGENPSQRPNVPKIEKVQKDMNWYKNALKGISDPIPVDILKMTYSQGNWHTPFTQPNLLDKYDIRGLHSKK